MSSKELVKVDIPPSDEVTQEELRAYRQYLVDNHLEGFRELDAIGPDEEHPDFKSRLLWKQIGRINKLRVYVVPVNEDLDPWGMDLHEYDDPRDLLTHPYGYGTKRGLVPETSDISSQPRAA